MYSFLAASRQVVDMDSDAGGNQYGQSGAIGPRMQVGRVDSATLVDSRLPTETMQLSENPAILCVTPVRSYVVYQTHLA